MACNDSDPGRLARHVHRASALVRKRPAYKRNGPDDAVQITDEMVNRAGSALTVPLYEITRGHRESVSAVDLGSLTKQGDDLRREVARIALAAALPGDDAHG